jgi:hypothetical protein
VTSLRLSALVEKLGRFELTLSDPSSGVKMPETKLSVALTVHRCEQRAHAQGTALYENQRWYPSAKWSEALLGTERGHWSNENGSVSAASSRELRDALGINVDTPMRLPGGGNCDVEGWEYAGTFAGPWTNHGSEGSVLGAVCSLMNATVRRRKWMLDPTQADVDEAERLCELDPTQTGRNFVRRSSGGPVVQLIKKGALSKQGHLNRNWKKRHFVVTAGLATYHEAPGGATKGSIALSEDAVVSVVEEGPAAGEDECFQFEVRCDGKVLAMRATSEADMSQWIHAFTEAAYSQAQ